MPRRRPRLERGGASRVGRHVVALVAIHPDESFEHAAQIMMENRVHHLPVIDDDGRLLGIVAQSDLGRRMSNRELGRLARETSIRGTQRQAPALVRAEH